MHSSSQSGLRALPASARGAPQELARLELHQELHLRPHTSGLFNMRAHETPQRLQTAGVGADPRGGEVGVDLRKLPLVGEARRPDENPAIHPTLRAACRFMEVPMGGHAGEAYTWPHPALGPAALASTGAITAGTGAGKCTFRRVYASAPCR